MLRHRRSLALLALFLCSVMTKSLRSFLCSLRGSAARLDGPKQAAEKFGFTKQRYYQLLKVYSLQGAAALASRKRGPQRNYRRTAEAVRQVIRHRFLDPDASAAVIAQQLTQSSFTISMRSVDRIIEDFGLQKKTVPLSSKA